MGYSVTGFYACCVVGSLFTERYRAVLSALVAARKERGVTQVELAARMGKRQTFISKIECEERRLDIVEYVDYARGIGVDPYRLLKKVLG